MESLKGGDLWEAKEAIEDMCLGNAACFLP